MARYCGIRISGAIRAIAEQWQQKCLLDGGSLDVLLISNALIFKSTSAACRYFAY